MPVVDTKLQRPGPCRAPAVPDRGRRPPPPPSPGNGDGQPRPRPAGLPLSNARLGTLMLLSGESMFFGGLVVAFLQLRLSAAVWPPPGQPRLPVGLTAANTLVLLGSSYTLLRALRAVRAGDRRGLAAWLAATGGLGTLFLTVQGLEWARLVHFGLTVSSGIFGATFYTLIGAHGAHVLGAVTWLGVTLAAAHRGRYTPSAHERLVCCAMYWHFVVALWPVLYFLVYLT